MLFVLALRLYHKLLESSNINYNFMFSLQFAGNFLAYFMFAFFAEFPIFKNAELFPYDFFEVQLTKTNEYAHVIFLNPPPLVYEHFRSLR